MSNDLGRQGRGLKPLRIGSEIIYHVNGMRTTYLVDRVALKLATSDESVWPKAIDLAKEYDLHPERVEQARELARMLRRSAQ